MKIINLYQRQATKQTIKDKQQWLVLPQRKASIIAKFQK